MTLKVIKEHNLSNLKIKNCIKRWTLNFTDITANNNKYYTLELLETDNNEFYLHTQYGRVGGTPAREYRLANNQSHAETEAEKIVKSKVKKGYVEVKLVKADVGSEAGKSKVEESSISIEEAKKLGFKIEEENKSNLHPEIQNLMRSWFGSIEKFVIDTIDTSKCALGQLSLDQINKGRDLLLEARKIVASDPKDISNLNSLTSKYYSTIPMNFGYRKLDANQLRFDSNDKLDSAFDILDSLENAKNAEKVINKKNAVDEQYKTLNCGLEWVDPQDPMFKWIDLLLHKTRAPNHGFLGKIKLNKVFKLERNKEKEKYLTMLDKIIAKGNQERKDLPLVYKPIWDKRPQENREYEKLCQLGNVLPLCHGSRTQNFPKILSSYIMMRKPGFTVAGAMFDKIGGIYNSSIITKSLQYSSLTGSYWSGGSDSVGYVFLTDVILGKQHIANKPHPYTLDEISPCMSVYAKGGTCVQNDEMIVYTEQQNWLRYVLEISKA